MTVPEQLIKSVITSEVAAEIYKDTLQPAAKQMGKNLETVLKTVTVALYPIEGSVWCFEQIKDWLCEKVSQKLKNIDPEKIQSPKASIAGPLILNLHFCKDEYVLRELYANLLASCMNGDLSSEAHPSFIHIIEQISPDEAKIIAWMAEQKRSNLYGEQLICQEIDEYYIYQELSAKIGLNSPKDIGSYMDNLLRLRIIERKQYTDISYVPAGSNRYGDWGPGIKKDDKEETYITDLGIRFMKCCILPYETNNHPKTL